MVVFMLESEWDLGLSETVFGSQEDLMNSLRSAHSLQNIEESVDQCFKDGLYSIKKLEVKSVW